MSRARIALTAAVAGTAAIGVSGYAVAGPTGLIDVASVVALVVLIVARGLVRGEKTPGAQAIGWPGRKRPKASDAAEFPGYRKIFADLSWAQVSWRHYEHPMRPMLTRLAAALDRQPAVAADLAVARDPDGPGIDLPTLDRIVTKLER